MVRAMPKPEPMLLLDIARAMLGLPPEPRRMMTGPVTCSFTTTLLPRTPLSCYNQHTLCPDSSLSRTPSVTIALLLSLTVPRPGAAVGHARIRVDQTLITTGCWTWSSIPISAAWRAGHGVGRLCASALIIRGSPEDRPHRAGIARSAAGGGPGHRRQSPRARAQAAAVSCPGRGTAVRRALEQQLVSIRPRLCRLGWPPSFSQATGGRLTILCACSRSSPATRGPYVGMHYPSDMVAGALIGVRRRLCSPARGTEGGW